MNGIITSLALALLWTLLQAHSALAAPIRVAYAGSMGAVMDQHIGPAFAKAHDVQYEGIGQGAYALAHLLAGKEMRADVFISVTPGPMRIMIKDGLVKRAVPVASTEMVIAYSPKSRFASRFVAAAHGKQAWYKVLETRGLRFGRTDPATDPQGRNIIFTFLLAQRYYHQPGLAKKILGAWRNPSQIFTEPSLLARLESGQVDASSGYLSAVLSQRLPFIKLPPEINLANPAYYDAWYSKASFAVAGPKGKSAVVKPAPLVFYAAPLANAEHPKLAAEFIAFITGGDGQKLLRDGGYDPPVGGNLR